MKLVDELKQKILANPIFGSPTFLKYQHLVIPGIVLIISLVISGLVTIPQLLKLFENNKTLTEMTTQKEFFRQKTATLNGIDLDLYRKNLDTALIALPVDKDIPGVTGELLVALSGSGLTLDGVTFAASNSESDKVSEFTLRLDVSGSSDNVKDFIERVKLAPRIVKMTSIDVSKSKSSPRMSASINLVTLYQPLPANIGTVEEKVPEITQTDQQTLADIRVKADAQPQAVNGATPVEGKLNPFAP